MRWRPARDGPRAPPGILLADIVGTWTAHDAGATTTITVADGGAFHLVREPIDGAPCEVAGEARVQPYVNEDSLGFIELTLAIDTCRELAVYPVWAVLALSPASMTLVDRLIPDGPTEVYQRQPAALE